MVSSYETLVYAPQGWLNLCMPVQNWKSPSHGNGTSDPCWVSCGFALLLERGILLTSSLSITFGTFPSQRGYSFSGCKDMVVFQICPMVRPMPSMLCQLQWGWYLSSKQKQSAPGSVVCPFSPLCAVLATQPQLSVSTTRSTDGISRFSCSAQVFVINDKTRAMQKICSNASNFTPRCLVLCSNHSTFLSKEVLQDQSSTFLPSTRDKGPEDQKLAIGVQMLWGKEFRYRAWNTGIKWPFLGAVDCMWNSGLNSVWIRIL